MAILNESLCIKVKAQAALLDSNHNSAVASGGNTACIRYSVLRCSFSLLTDSTEFGTQTVSPPELLVLYCGAASVKVPLDDE